MLLLVATAVLVSTFGACRCVGGSTAEVVSKFVSRSPRPAMYHQNETIVCWRVWRSLCTCVQCSCGVGLEDSGWVGNGGCNSRCPRVLPMPVCLLGVDPHSDCSYFPASALHHSTHVLLDLLVCVSSLASTPATARQSCLHPVPVASCNLLLAPPPPPVTPTLTSDDASRPHTRVHTLNSFSLQRLHAQSQLRSAARQRSHTAQPSWTGTAEGAALVVNAAAAWANGLR
jgi:hypothetical protein